MKEGITKARTLLFDVESFPNIGYTWGKWEQNVIEFIEEKKIVSFAWKWLGETKVDCLALPTFKSYKTNKKSNLSLITELHKLISKADIVVAHNVDNFDDKMANSDFITNGLTPPPPHKTVDTLKVARSKFSFNSNKLDDLAFKLGFGRKVNTGGFSLWKGCMEGNEDSWDKMIEYNKHDVVLLEKVYLKLRPWMTNHPAIALPSSTAKCSVCSSDNLKRGGYSILKTGKYQRFHCADCGKWDRLKIKGD